MDRHLMPASAPSPSGSGPSTKASALPSSLHRRSPTLTKGGGSLHSTTPVTTTMPPHPHTGGQGTQPSAGFRSPPSPHRLSSDSQRRFSSLRPLLYAAILRAGAVSFAPPDLRYNTSAGLQSFARILMGLSTAHPLHIHFSSTGIKPSICRSGEGLPGASLERHHAALCPSHAPQSNVYSSWRL